MALNLQQYGYTLPKQQEQPQGRGLASYTSEAGGVLGGLLGSLVSPGAGSVAGATIGGGLGQALENKLLGKKQTAGSIAGEAAMSGGGQLLGLGIGKLASSFLSKGATKGSVSLLKKAYKPSATAIKKSAFNNVDDWASYVAKNHSNLSEKAITSLQSQYDDIALNSGAKTSAGKLISKLTKEAKTLAKSPSQAERALSKKLLTEIGNVGENIGTGKVDIGELTKIRRIFDNSVKNFGKDELTDASLWMRNRLANVINDTADAAAIKSPSGLSLSKVGKELSKRYSASNIINSAVERGSTRSLLNLPALVGGGVGSAGGVPGAVVGAGLGSAAGNPAVIGTGANLLSRLGSATAGGLGTTGSRVAGALGQSAVTGARNMLAPTTQQTTMPEMQGGMGSMPQTGMQGTGDISSGLDKNFFTKAIFNDFAQTGGKNVNQIMAVAKFLGADQATKAPTAAQAQVGGYANRLQSANQIFDQLEPTVAGKLTGKLSIGRRLGAFKAEDVKLQEQAERNFINALLRRESGAAIAPAEFESAAKQYFPQPGDTPAVLAQKRQNRYLVQQNLSAEAQGTSPYSQDSVGQLLSQFGG